MTTASIDQLLYELRRFRRRAAAVRFLRVVTITVPIALLAVEALGLLGWWPPSPFIAVLTVTAPALLTAAAAAAFTPSLTVVASRADHRLRLHNQLATALQYGRDDDAYAQLIVRGAVDAARNASSTSAFPFAMPRIVTPLALAAAGAGVLLLLLGTIENTASIDGTRAARSAGVTGAGAGGQGQTTRSAPQPITETRNGGSQRADPEIAAGSRAAAIGANADATPMATPVAGQQAAVGAGRRAAGPEGSAGTRSDQTTAAVRATTAAAGGTGAGTGRGGSERPGGGVTRGALTRSTATLTQPAAPTAPPSYRDAWESAQAAMTRNRVPVRLRAYVRQYLTDIREPETR